MDTDSNMIGLSTKEIIKDLESLENLFDCSILYENHQLISKKNEKVIGEYKIETPENNCIDEFNFLRSKMYAIKGDDSNKKLKLFLKINQKRLGL